MRERTRARKSSASFGRNDTRALNQYQQIMNTVAGWPFRERWDVAYWLLMKGLPLRTILLYPLIQVLSLPRRKHIPAIQFVVALSFVLGISLLPWSWHGE